MLHLAEPELVCLVYLQLFRRGMLLHFIKATVFLQCIYFGSAVMFVNLIIINDGI